MQALAKEISIVPVDSIARYAGNARKHGQKQIDKIAASIAEFGFNAPILIDENNTIVAGHGRYLAALKLGMKEVPVIALTHLSEAKRKAYIIADNRLAEDSSWDMGKLAAEVASLQNEDFDLSAIGLEEVDYSRLDMEMRRMNADLQAIEQDLQEQSILPPPSTGFIQTPPPAGQAEPEQQTLSTPSTAAPHPPIPSMPQMVAFNCVMLESQREAVLRVLNQVKADNGLTTIGEAMHFVCQSISDV